MHDTRHFFGLAKRNATVHSCLTAWESMFQNKENCGPGIKNMEDLNHCLLMKFVHRIYDPEMLPWKQWFISHSSLYLRNEGDSFLT